MGKELVLRLRVQKGAKEPKRGPGNFRGTSLFSSQPDFLPVCGASQQGLLQPISTGSRNASMALPTHVKPLRKLAAAVDDVGLVELLAMKECGGGQGLSCRTAEAAAGGFGAHRHYPLKCEPKFVVLQA